MIVVVTHLKDVLELTDGVVGKGVDDDGVQFAVILLGLERHEDVAGLGVEEQVERGGVCLGSWDRLLL